MKFIAMFLTLALVLVTTSCGPAPEAKTVEKVSTASVESAKADIEKATVAGDPAAAAPVVPAASVAAAAADLAQSLPAPDMRPDDEIEHDLKQTAAARLAAKATKVAEEDKVAENLAAVSQAAKDEVAVAAVVTTAFVRKVIEPAAEEHPAKSE